MTENITVRIEENVKSRSADYKLRIPYSNYKYLQSDGGGQAGRPG
jgi:hypothetical protein